MALRGAEIRLQSHAKVTIWSDAAALDFTPVGSLGIG